MNTGDFLRQRPLMTVGLYAAELFVGNSEVGGNNRGPMVGWCLRAAGLDEGYAWCAAFVNAAAELAGAIKNLRSPLEQVPNQALVQSYADWAEAEGRTVEDPARVKTGAIFCLETGRTDRTYDHMGLVSAKADVPDNHYPTVEANTSPGTTAGSAADRDGDVVTRKTRSFSELNPLFIHWEP